jgi:hypothetical protein
MAKLTDLPRLIKQALEREAFLEAGAKEIKKIIPKRTRAGDGVQQNLGSSHLLPRLTENTIKRREKLSKNGKLSGAGATPAKSNFTRSGDSLANIETKVSKGKIDVNLNEKDQHKLQDALQINPRYQFMRLSKVEFNQVLDAITDKLSKALSKVNITDL